MYDISNLLPFLIPLVLLQVGLFIAAIVHIFKHNNYRRGNRVIWVLVSFINIIGPILYFVIGRGRD